MKLQFFGGVAMMGAAGIFMVVDASDKAMNYVEVNARVSAVTAHDCWIEVGDERWTPKPGYKPSCGEVAKVVALTPGGKAELKGSKTVEVRYESPVDKQVHKSEVTLNVSNAAFAKAEPGEVVLILANTSKADKVRAR